MRYLSPLVRGLEPRLRHNRLMRMTKNGDPDWIRTSDPQIRNLMLYPAELRDRRVADTRARSL